MKLRFPVENEDKGYLPLLSSIQTRPVFVMGFHRSGTTFIYDSIAKCFPLANLDLYSIFFYERMLTNYVSGNEQTDRDWFNNYIRYCGIEDRGLDRFEVSHDMVEEYCWVLSKSNWLFPATQTTRANGRRLREVCRKIQYCNPQSEGVLLKNPFDFTNAKALLRLFPNAKFIFVKRSPAEILNSTYNSVLSMARPHPFFELMRSTQPPLSRYLAEKMGGLMNRMSDEQLMKLSSVGVKNALKKRLTLARRSLQSLPQDSYVVADYDEFNSDPVAALEKIQSTLGLRFSTSPETINPRPRKKMLNDTARKYAEEVNAYAW